MSKNYYASAKIKAAYKRAIKDGISNPIKQDYTMEAVNGMLYTLLGVPNAKPVKGSGTNDITVNGDSGRMAGTALYSSAQVDEGAANIAAANAGSNGPAQGMDWIAQGIGLIRDVIGYGYSAWSSKKAYERQNEFYDNHLSMSAKAKEYEEAGLNPMGLAGAGVGATSAPSVQQASMPNADGLTSMMTSLLGYKAQMAQIEVDKDRVAAQKEDIASKIEYRASQKLYQDKINEWFDTNQIVDINKSIAETQKALEEINTEKTKQALNAAGISEKEANAALSIQLALQKEFENSPEYRQNVLRLQSAQSNMYNANAAHLYEDIKNLASQREEIASRIALNYANTDIGKQQLINLGLTEKQIQFAVDHQKGDLIFQRINQVTGSLKDIGIAAAGITSAASGGLTIASQLTPRKPIGF